MAQRPIHKAKNDLGSDSKTTKIAGSNSRHERAVEVLRIKDITTNSQEVIGISNCEYVASYNWVKSNEPAILVPGMFEFGAPALWSPPALPITLSKDDGAKRIEATKDRVVTPQWAPLFATLQVMKPTFSFDSISLVVERNSLRKLLDAAKGCRTNSDWRINAEVVNGTLFLTRWEANPQYYLTGSYHTGYGYTFEDTFSRYEEDVKESCAHHRIVTYDIGDMKWMVRAEADGYLRESQEETGAVGVTPAQLLEPHQPILGALRTMTLNGESKTQVIDGLTVFHKGHMVPSRMVIELQSKQIGRKGNNKKAQCWFSQTEHLLVGRREMKTFKAISHEVVDFGHWEAQNQDALSRLLSIIAELKRFAEENGKGFARYTRTRPGMLSLYKDNSIGLELSDELKDRHWASQLV